MFHDHSEEAEEVEEDDEAWDQVREHEAAGLFFGRRRKKREPRELMTGQEPVLDVLAAQGSLIADNVLSVVTPALRGLAASGKRRKEEIEESLRDLVRLKKELAAAREEASHYRTLLEDCLEQATKANPNQPTIEMERDLQNALDAGNDLEREHEDIAQETNTLGRNLLESLQEEEKEEEDVLKDVSAAMREQIAVQEERVETAEPPALPPREAPALPPRDALGAPPAAPPAPVIRPQGRRLVIQPRARPIPLPRDEAAVVQETTKDVLVAAFNKTWAAVNANVEEEQETEEERRQREAEEEEWNAEFYGGVATHAAARIEGRVRASTHPIRARLEAMRKRREKERRERMKGGVSITVASTKVFIDGDDGSKKEKASSGKTSKSPVVSSEEAEELFY
jgi:hypothetical protein